MTDAAEPRRKPKPHPGVLMAKIRELAAAGSYSQSAHIIFDRGELRDIDIFDALDVLRLGEIAGPIEPGFMPGEWRCKVTAKIDRSSRSLGVAVVVQNMKHLLMATVEWEDIR
jgi:hypothetical protein